ncbi:MAG: histidine kinase [Betaproteobacteria bacterium]|nr:histidine kinase [Betaproteobacteria bacterium]MDE2122820.1 histidine kinase [Betaproteobacteria bacterium]MDE2186487.1 histidine kinase [Betaproteobacteria bacterium]MDE2324444.1 histidine kinase [Betaproteobacteria bacterium]
MQAAPVDLNDRRLKQIDRARQLVIAEGHGLPAPGLGPQRGWIERSWRRCLEGGRRPEQRLEFDSVSASSIRANAECHHTLLQTARPVLAALSRAIARTRYFAILTDAEGIVLDVALGAGHDDRRIRAIARVGVNLSEPSIGTSAISAALTELHPVWLHRGEHFFADTNVYSCAGAPVFGPDGRCLGMIDLTGVLAEERPELMHLAAQAARCVENALTRQRPHALCVHLSWPGQAQGGDQDGLICLDNDGWIVGANQAARQMIPDLSGLAAEAVHANDLFAVSHAVLFERARLRELSETGPLEVPLWSGLSAQILPETNVWGAKRGAPAASLNPLSLRQYEAALVRHALRDAQGNVMQAARALGISRATLYRKLGHKPSP